MNPMIINNYSEAFFILKNGVKIPAIGLSTFKLHDNNAFHILDAALAAGYRLFDTASAYGNEEVFRDALSILLPKHGLTREQIYITTKLSPLSSGGQIIAKILEKTLQNLGVDYVDMYLIHFPGNPNVDLKVAIVAALSPQTWSDIAQLCNESKIRAIGVSNCSVKYLIKLSRILQSTPLINQVEWNPFSFDLQLLQYCYDNNIQLQAYNCFGSLNNSKKALIGHPVVNEMAARYHATPGQILLLWSLQRGVAVIPRSKEINHLFENRSMNFKLLERDIFALDALRIPNFDQPSTSAA